jgi:hypothetical protein
MIWGFSLHGWEDLMRGSLLIVGVSGLIAGLSTWFVVKLQRAEIAQSAIELAQYKSDAAVNVEEAKNEGVNAGKAAGSALVRAAELEKQAQELKAANLKLEAEIAPRNLSPDQQKEIGDALRQFEGTQFVTWLYPSDAESRRLEAQIKTSLGLAGFSFAQQMSNADAGMLITGVRISSSTAGKPIGEAIAAILKSKGIESIADAEGPAAWPEKFVRIWVGVKPIAQP